MAQEITVGGGGGFKLAPDLDYISNKSGISTTLSISSIDASQGFATALYLEGKFYLNYLTFSNLNSGIDVGIKLTIDGVLIWDSSATTNTSLMWVLGYASTNTVYPETIYCESSLLLEVSQSGNSDIVLNYLARPIL